MPLILGANSVSGGYEIDNSLRFNAASSDYLNRTPASASNRKTWTWSGWVKRSKLGIESTLFAASNSGGNSHTGFLFNTDDTLKFFSSNAKVNLITTQVFRDVSAWYHIVVVLDTPQATNTNRAKIYVNGSEITAFSTATYPLQDSETDLNINNTIYHAVGRYGDFSSNWFNDGYMSDVALVDGQALTPSSFGQTDPSVPSSGIWIPKAYSGSYGTNGFYLKFANSAALGTDSSGNGNTYTVNNLTSIDQSTDTPTNNFATGNPLDVNGMTFTEGNLLGAAIGIPWKSSRGTIGMSQGKWYWEMKATASASSFDGQIGVGLFSLPIASYGEWTTANPSVIYSAGDGTKWVNGVNSAYGSTWTVGDIIGVAFDADNLTVTFYKNGVSQGTITTSWTANTYAPEIAFYGRDGGTTSGSFNFGSPAFTIASGNADANGYGNFEYAVPSGYYALCTKNLADYG